jgi:hypothetical protein
MQTGPRGEAFVIACLLVFACGDTGERAGGPCARYTGIAKRETITQSPFPNPEAEALAIEASGELVAPPDVYHRILHDLSGIRASNPAVADIHAMPSWAADELIIAFDAEGTVSVTAGTYTEWNCANDLYGMSSSRTLGESSQSVLAHFFVLHFDHRFNAPLLASQYATLPHVTSVSPEPAAGDGDDVCVSSDGDTYSYVFDAGSGDCPAGCIEHTYWGFLTPRAGDEVISLGKWSNASGSPPPWFTALAACTKWL